MSEPPTVERMPFRGKQRRLHLVLLAHPGGEGPPRLLLIGRPQDRVPFDQALRALQETAAVRNLDLRIAQVRDGAQDLSAAWARGVPAAQWLKDG